MYPTKLYQDVRRAYKKAQREGCQACPAYSEKVARGYCARECSEEILLALKCKRDWLIDLEQRWFK